MNDRMERVHFILRLLFLVVWFAVVAAAIFYFSRDGILALAAYVAGWFS